MLKKKTLITVAGLGGLIGAAGASQIEPQRAVVPEKNERTPVQRDKLPAPQVAPGLRGVAAPAVFPLEFRTIDGTLNNGVNPTWGAAATPFIRVVPADYGDGVGTPAGAGRPGAREISSAVFAQGATDMANPYQLTDFMWQWGQFLDHDIDETPIPGAAESFDIDIPTGDPFFDPMSMGTMTIPLGRSATVSVGGVDQQVNNITSFIDASNVYGAEDDRAHELRTNDGTGMLKTSAGDLLPYNTTGEHNAPDDNDPSFFFAGDIRANEQAGLTAIHTLFMREHNRLATIIANENPGFTGDEIYEHARAFVVGEMQAITYNEFLPHLLGPAAIPAYSGYDDSVNPSISNLFATAAYRVGHTMLSTQIQRLDATGNEIGAGHLDLASAFFDPIHVETHGIESILRGLASQHAQNVDAFVVDDIRNFLFGPPGSGGLDLASLNIQRGRDHGLPGYNDIRTAFGRPAAATFADVNPDPTISGNLASVYATPDDIDAWVGLLAEPHAQQAFVGETLKLVLAEQFTRLRDGDRFWYESYLPAPMVAEVEAMTLSEVIRANTSIGSEIQDDAFQTASGLCLGDCDNSGSVEFADLVSMLFQFGNDTGDGCDADASGTVDFGDLIAALFMFGDCPI